MSIITTDQPQRRGIKNLLPGLVERGKIKIGEKGAMRQSQNDNSFQMPKKLDHFRITSMVRGQDGNFVRDESAHRLYGDMPTRIPVVLLYDDIDLNFQTRYASYNGKTLACSGDGESARQMTRPAQGNNAAQYDYVPCVCHRQAPDYQGKDKCKINGTLSVMLQGVDVIGGVWKLRTTSYNSVVGIMSSLALIKRITGGPLAGIPLMLTLTPKQVADPIRGTQQTIFVVGLEYHGSLQSLQTQGYQTLLTRQQHNVRIEQLENEAHRLLSADPTSFAAADDETEEVEEFYPEAIAGEFIAADAASDADELMSMAAQTAPQQAPVQPQEQVQPQKSLEERKGIMIAKFEKLGVTSEQIEAKAGPLGKMTDAAIAALSADYTAIKNGAPIGSLFPVTQPAQSEFDPDIDF